MKAVPILISAVLFLATTLPLSSQTVPAGEEGHSPFSVGGGVSNFDVDWGHGRMYGGTLWLDWHPSFVPRILDGIGLEAEARDISIGHSSSQPSNFRLDTGGGGVIYTWRHFRNVRPYAKYLVSLGSFDFRSRDPYYSHDTRTVTAIGGGVEARVFRNVRVRADYEYQFWPDFDLAPNGSTLDPQGFTLGAMYDFGRFHLHRLY
ncbi:MAG: outer membrane beta-barrel protein [Terracidiphilus sp.]